MYFCCIWQKIDQTKSILKGLYQTLWRGLDTRRWKNSKDMYIRKLVVDSQVVFAVLLTGFGRSLIYQVLLALFSELHRLRHTIKNFVVTVVSRLEYIHVQQVESLRKLGIQAVCLAPSFNLMMKQMIFKKNKSNTKVQESVIIIYNFSHTILALDFRAFSCRG